MFDLVNFLLKIAVRIFFELPFVEDHTKTNKKVKDIVDLYNNSGFAGMSAKIRFWDSPLERLEKIVPKSGTILDLGCGEGILTNYLALCQPDRKMIGIEISQERTQFANRNLKNTKFITKDVLKTKLPPSDAIVISHMMHHLPSRDDQVVLLKNCYKSLRKGGKLVIADIDRGWSIKYLLGWFTDVVIVPILFEKSLYNGAIFHRSKKEWKKVLEDVGFRIEKLQDFKGGPFPDIGIVASKS